MTNTEYSPNLHKYMKKLLLTMSVRSVLQVFANYHKARFQFVQNIADLASKPHNIAILNQANVFDLLKPLLTDISPQIRQCAAVAFGRLVENDEKTAQKLLNSEILAVLMTDIDSQNKYFKRSILYIIRSICKHDPSLAKDVIQAGGLSFIIYCMGDFEPMVKESALWAVGYIARHNLELAMAVVDAGAIPNVVLCLQEPEINMKHLAVNVISDIAKHSLGLAQQVTDCGAVPYLAKCINNQDEKLKRIAFNALSNIAKQSLELAECVVEANTFPNTLIHLAHACPRVRKAAVSLVRDVVKHSVALTQMVVNLGGIGALVECSVQDKTGEVKLPAYVCLGYIAGQNEQIALCVMNCNVVQVLAETLMESKDDELLAITAWALGQIGKHSPEHSKGVAAENVFPRLLRLFLSQQSSQDLQDKAKMALKQCLQKCLYVGALEPLIYEAPPSILKYILGQYTKILPNDPKARRMFVTSGALKRIQEIEAEPGTTLMEYITIINTCFPEEIVRYYSPGYSETLLDQVEQYTPQFLHILREARMTNGSMQAESGYVIDETNSNPSVDLKAMM